MEEWRDIAGYEGIYQVSSLGRVRSLDREIHYINGRIDVRKGQIKSQRPRKDGYMQVNLCRESVKVCVPVQYLVFEAFHGKRDKSLDVCHRDGNRANNEKNNLRQDTRKGNFSDMVEHGTRCRGERHGTHKLTREQVIAIRADNRTQRAIAMDYGVAQAHIGRIKRGLLRKWDV